MLHAMSIIQAIELSTDGMAMEPVRADHADEMVGVLADESIYDFIGGDPPALATRRAPLGGPDRDRPGDR